MSTKKIYLSNSFVNSRKIQQLTSILCDEGFKINYGCYFVNKILQDDFCNHEIENKIKSQIIESQCVLIYANRKSSNSQWTKKEIKYSLESNVPIIALIPNNQQRQSKIIKQYADTIIQFCPRSLLDILSDTKIFQRSKI